VPRFAVTASPTPRAIRPTTWSLGIILVHERNDERARRTREPTRRVRRKLLVASVGVCTVAFACTPSKSRVDEYPVANLVAAPVLAPSDASVDADAGQG